MKLSYYNSNYNFGDLLNVTLLNDLFGVKNVVHKNSVHIADMIAIGSLAERLIQEPKNHGLKKYCKSLYRFYKTPKIEVFGTGFINENHSTEIQLIRRVHIMALRGKLTKSKLEKISSKEYNKIVLGDPGLLCKHLIDNTNVIKKYRLGIIPHYVDKTNRYISEIQANNPNSKIIDIQQEPYAFLKEISQCDTVVSSAMHGLIAADSLNIPNIRLILSDKLTGGDFKFNDYYSVFGIENHVKLDFFNNAVSSTKLSNLPDLVTKNFILKSNKIDNINNKLIHAFKSKSRFS
jgi:hypothetical protein